MTEAVGIADGDDRVTHRDGLRGSEGERGQGAGIHSKQRDIRRGVGAYDLRRNPSAVEERYTYGAGAHDDMAIGDDQPVRTNMNPEPKDRFTITGLGSAVRGRRAAGA